MRARSILLLGAAVGALILPATALAHNGRPDGGGGEDRAERWEKWGWGWGNGWWEGEEQEWTLGADVALTGYGSAGGHVQVPAPQPGTTAPAPPTVTMKGRGGVLKVLAVSSDVKVDCKGQGYRRERTTFEGAKVIVCRGLGSATISGSDWHFRARFKIAQATFPAGLSGTLSSWGYWWTGPTIPDDPDDQPLT